MIHDRRWKIGLFWSRIQSQNPNFQKPAAFVNKRPINEGTRNETNLSRNLKGYDFHINAGFPAMSHELLEQSLVLSSMSMTRLMANTYIICAFWPIFRRFSEQWLVIEPSVAGVEGATSSGIARPLFSFDKNTYNLVPIWSCLPIPHLQIGPA